MREYGHEPTGLYEVLSNQHEVVMVWATDIPSQVRLRAEPRHRARPVRRGRGRRPASWRGSAASAEYVTGGDTHIMTPLPRTVYGPDDWEDASLDDWLAERASSVARSTRPMEQEHHGQDAVQPHGAHAPEGHVHRRVARRPRQLLRRRCSAGRSSSHQLGKLDTILLRPDDGQFILIAQAEKHLASPGMDHLGLLLDTREEVDHLLDLCRRFAEKDDRMQIVDYTQKDLVTGNVTVHAFYVKYLLPLYFDIQVHRARRGQGPGAALGLRLPPCDSRARP